MKHRVVISLFTLLVASRAFTLANQADSKRQEGELLFEIDQETLKVLKKINRLNAYQAPNLALKQDPIYAWTSKDVEPFRHVNPHKRHFLLQMEYTGAGRAIPEPNDVETVKLGFIGPIMSTVSVATGGKSHEEPLGIKMLQGARLG